MKYIECREWLEERRKNMGSVPGLKEVTSLLEAFKRPDKELNIIHIAGTNGKGSTGYLLESILSKSGIKTGRFLSPAVTDEREIISVNNKMVFKTVWEKHLSEIIEVIEKTGIKATAFEIEFVLSLLIFKEAGCKAVILECGMGGTLDATNAIDESMVDIITSISIDHCNFLGDSLKEISLHKFGIIKNGSKNVILAPQTEEVYEFFDKYLEGNKLQVKTVKSDSGKTKYKINRSKNGISQVFDYKEYKQLRLSLLGTHQIDNAKVVLDTADVLKAEGWCISDKAIRKAFEEALWPGRFEIIEKDRTYILDGAHNYDAVLRLFENINLYFTKRNLIYIMGMYKDKAYEDVIAFCAPKAKAVVCISAKDKARAIDAFEIGKCVKEYNENVTAADSYEEALEIAGLLSDKKDVVLIFGSLSFLGDFRELLLK
ncbi:MAG: bifunctional folylpolyglutamate synthase/dihydrofolate synthase [Lachnospiraceae bacterium]|nr:bifunctional folylpolyglutamate synthase/dihydrofolate synthase [Lachnospiraceae bacterium]